MDQTGCAASVTLPRAARRHVARGLLLAAALILLQPAFASACTKLGISERHLASQTPSEPNAAGDGGPLADCLAGSWIHSWEEDTDDVTVYRPADHPFPPSRGREGYEFLPGGALIYHGIGPADGPTNEPGRWEMVAPNQVAVTIEQSDGPGVAETFDIVTCNADGLEVAR